MQACRTVVGVAQHVGHPRPELPSCAEFCDGHELVRIGDEPEADAAHRVADTDSGAGLQP